MITCTGTIRVLRMSRKSRLRPGKRSFAKAYPALRLINTVAITETHATTTELPNQRAKGYCCQGST
jgi:hypothetical protein